MLEYIGQLTYDLQPKQTFRKHEMTPSLWPNNKPCVLVASIGRSGSTLAADTLSRQARTIWKRKPALFQESLALAPLELGTICKTHDYPEALRGRTEPVKALFLFGSTLDAAVSVHNCLGRLGSDWVKLHFEHMKSKGKAEELFHYDVLGMAKQIKAWSTFDAVPTMSVRYDALWKHSERIADFTGYRFVLPEFRARVGREIEERLTMRAKEVYGPIDEIIMKLPEIFQSGPSMARYVSDLT